MGRGGTSLTRATSRENEGCLLAVAQGKARYRHQPNQYRGWKPITEQYDNIDAGPPRMPWTTDYTSVVVDRLDVTWLKLRSTSKSPIRCVRAVIRNSGTSTGVWNPECDPVRECTDVATRTFRPLPAGKHTGGPYCYYNFPMDSVLRTLLTYLEASFVHASCALLAIVLASSSASLRPSGGGVPCPCSRLLGLIARIPVLFNSSSLARARRLGVTCRLPSFSSGSPSTRGLSLG